MSNPFSASMSAITEEAKDMIGDGDLLRPDREYERRTAINLPSMDSPRVQGQLTDDLDSAIEIA
jgi:hypothetical protein